MSKLTNRWRLALVGSVGLHLTLALFIGVNIASKPTPNQLAAVPQPEVVQAVAINEQQILKEIERRENIEKADQKREIERKNRLEQEVEKARKLRQQEERKIAVLQEKAKKEQLEQQQARVRAEKKSKEAEAKEQQRIAALKKEQQLLQEQKKKEQQQLDELARQSQIEQQKRVDEERRVEEARLQKIEEQRLAAERAAFEKKLADEQSRLQQEANKAQQRQLALEKNRYVALIREKVVRNWVKPSGTVEGNSCKVLVHQIPGGEVIDVKVTACSGSVAFRNSVERAVFRASPLPTPATKEIFDREIVFTFTP